VLSFGIEKFVPKMNHRSPSALIGGGGGGGGVFGGGKRVPPG